MLESLFKKATGLKTWNLIKKRLEHGCFPGNITTFLKTYTYGGYFCTFTLTTYREFSQVLSGKNINAATGDVLKIFTDFTGKQLCWSLFLIKFEIFKNAFTQHLRVTASAF